MNRIDVSPFEIQVFLEVAASGSFSRAAETSGLSQPAVSRAIGRLEQRLNIRLFDRTTRQVVLTPHGQTFLPIARRVVRDLTVSLDELGSYVSSVVGHVTVAALPSVAATLLPEALRRFHADYPAVTIAILDSFQDNVAGAVARGEADFGLSVQPPPRQGWISRRWSRTDSSPSCIGTIPWQPQRSAGRTCSPDPSSPCAA